MLRQTLVGLTLLAFLNFLIGCSTVQKVPAAEAQRGAQEITELVLLEGTVIQFPGGGAKFRPAQLGIGGKSVDGKPIFVALATVRQCRITPLKSISVKDLGNAQIKEVVLRSNVLVTFEEPGARYDSTVGKITGKRIEGVMASYDLSVVKSIRSERPTAISKDELALRKQQAVYEVVDPQNTVVTFDSTGGRFDTRPPLFYGVDTHGKPVEVPADSVLYATVTKTDPVGTTLAIVGVIVGVVGVAFLIALATKQSCPFIYSFNGEQYIFDAEPLGGAICPGLARTDISRLDYLKAVDGEYRLLIRNEVPETQYIDRMKLLVVDHPSDLKVYPDLQGKFYAFKNVQGVTSVSDEKGMSLMNFLRASDDVVWQTHLPSASKEVNGPVRHEITVTLPKPAGAKKAWLITNIGTSSWGSNMIRKTVEYRGNTTETWLKSVMPGSQPYVELYQFIEREEMYHLKAWVRERKSWKEEAVILGQGPLISEDRVYPLDVSNALGDSLMLRFNPPKGFWTFDYIGVSYEDPIEMDATRINANWAQDQHGNPILGCLDSADHAFCSMPEVGNWAGVSFSVPAQSEGTMRSAYLETSGYYELHLPKDKPDQLARLYDIWMNPGQIVKTAMEEFRSWQAEQQAAWDRSQGE